MKKLQQNESTVLQVIRIFLASPGDLAEERRAVRDAISEVNKTVARPSGFQLDLIAWEDTLSAMGRPQATINAEMETCDVFIGALWQRWGTAPANTSKYTSGFEEEYSRSRQRYKTSKLPEIYLFFKNVEESKIQDAGPELRKVLEFRRKLIDEKQILFKTFDTSVAFAAMVRITIANYVNALARSPVANGSQVSGDRKEIADENTVHFPSIPVVAIEETGFLTIVINRLRDEKGQGIEAVEVARLRNLGAALSGSNNDESSLGPHDANLIYKDREAMTFSGREINALAEAGLDHLETENVPIWTWLVSRLNKFPQWLAYETLMGPDARRLQAFRVMTTLAYVIPEDDVLTRSKIVEAWFETTNLSLKEAALRYLTHFGVDNDLAWVEKEVELESKFIGQTAKEAGLAIHLRKNRVSAARYLIQQNLSGESFFVKDGLDAIAQLSTDELYEALVRAGTSIKGRVLEILIERGSLSPDLMQKLLDDKSPAIRKRALELFVDNGRSVLEPEAEAILVRRKDNSLLLGIAEGSQQFAEFKKRQLARMPFEDLRKLAVAAPSRFGEVYFALFSKDPKANIDQLRKDFDDSFAGFYDRYLRDIETNLGESFESVREILMDSRKSKIRSWMREALDLISIHGDKKDISRVRNALDQDLVDPKTGDIGFISRFGNQDDISRVSRIQGDNRSNIYGTLLTQKTDNHLAAQAVLQLGANNLTLIMASGIATRLLAMVIALLTKTSFKRLTEGSLLELLNHSEDAVRRVTALKMLSVLGAGQIRSFLSRYVGSDKHRFYNVIFWLDLSTAFGVSEVREIADRELEFMIRE